MSSTARRPTCALCWLRVLGDDVAAICTDKLDHDHARIRQNAESCPSEYVHISGIILTRICTHRLRLHIIYL